MSLLASACRQTIGVMRLLEWIAVLPELVHSRSPSAYVPNGAAQIAMLLAPAPRGIYRLRKRNPAERPAGPKAVI